MSDDQPTCIWDGTNTSLNSDNNDDLGYNDLYEPWKNIIVSVETATANIGRIQNTLRKENKYIINTDNIANASSKRGVLRNTITIQLSSNRNFVSIEFDTQQIMETFCSQHLVIRGFNIECYPDKKKEQSEKRLMNISFLNIPPEILEHLVTDFVNTYSDIECTPLYPKKTHNCLEYCIGTRVYQVTKLYQHIPRLTENIFGRTI